jgi:hypothetical protein
MQMSDVLIYVPQLCARCEFEVTDVYYAASIG